MGQLPSSVTPLQRCLNLVCPRHHDCLAYPNHPLYDISWVRPYNLEALVTPLAVLRPSRSSMVAEAVNCATKHGSFVQARSGGHSYGNYGLGGDNGAVVIDLVNLNSFSMDKDNNVASFGAGLRLGELDRQLHKHGRAIPHGTCPGVGVGGQATIGGLGPSSRMWGTLADHIVQVEVVVKGEVRRASEHENPDLFWALRGAGPSFGIITKFWMKTHPEPGSVVEYTYDVSFGNDPGATKEIFKQWQDLAGDVSLDRRFSSLLIIHPLGVIVSGTFYGSQRDFDETGILERLPKSSSLRLNSWLGSVAHHFESIILQLADVPTRFVSKSLALRPQDVLNNDETDALFDFMYGDEAHVPMVAMFNTEGGAVADLPLNHTSYPHRDKVIMFQSYVIGGHEVPPNHKRFLTGVYERVKRHTPLGGSTYAGYIDMALSSSDAVFAYWGDMLPRLRQIKLEWDPNNVFRNPQSVPPAMVR